MKSYLQIAIAVSSTGESEQLIAVLSDLGYYAFEEKDQVLLAYIRQEDYNEDILKSCIRNGIFEKNVINEENWNQQWESSVEPVVVKDFAAIRPSFSKPINNVNFDLIITPKMSFGTGHHATTYLMVEMMETVEVFEKNVLDFGTGTGVLAILAEKCGAAAVIAIDYDQWSVTNANENVRVNNCNKIRVLQADNIKIAPPVDVILANINLNVLKDNADDLKALLKRRGVLIVSGFLEQDGIKMEQVFG